MTTISLLLCFQCRVCNSASKHPAPWEKSVKTEISNGIKGILNSLQSQKSIAVLQPIKNRAEAEVERERLAAIAEVQETLNGDNAGPVRVDPTPNVDLDSYPSELPENCPRDLIAVKERMGLYQSVHEFVDDVIRILQFNNKHSATTDNNRKMLTVKAS